MEPAELAESAERPEASDEDLADVIGDETLAETKKAESQKAESQKGAVGEVIDLTEHDEAEHIEMPKLRSAIS